MKDPIPGDHFLLYTHLPIDGSLYSHLPIRLADGVSLASTPYHAVARGAPEGSSPERHVGLGAWVYPGHGLGMGQCHACLKMDASLSSPVTRRYGWAMAGALYLAKPIYTAIGGSFTYSTPEDGLLGRETDHINHRSNICLDSFFTYNANDRSLLQYEKEDFALAGRLFPLILRCLEQRQQMPRPYLILQRFLEAVLWERLHYASSSFSKLFPALDAFAGNPPRHHANRVSRRIGLFLSNTRSIITGAPLTAQEIETRLKAIWDDHRPPGIHGYVKDISFPSSNIKPKPSPEIKDLFDLMEITRMAVVKMLLLEPTAFQEYNQIAIPKKVDDAAEIRTALSDTFFEKTYPSPQELGAYTDLLPFSLQTPAPTATISSP